jgi:hypothetical protein
VINPYTPPAADAAPENLGPLESEAKHSKRARVEPKAHDDQLTVGQNIRLPSVCLKCASTQGLARRVETFDRRWLFWGYQAKIALPLCEPCDTRWRLAKRAKLLTLVGLVGSVGVLGLSLVGIVTVTTTLLAVVALIAGLVALRGYVKPRILHASRIDEASITFGGVNSRAASTVVQLLNDLAETSARKKNRHRR